MQFSRQRGISYWGVVAVIGLLGASIKIGAVVGPIYLDYYTIDKMIAAKFREPQVDELDLKTFRDSLAGQMDRNNMRDRKLDDLMVIKRDGKKLIIELDYEERRQMFGNLDVVVHFKKDYSSERPDGISEG